MQLQHSDVQKSSNCLDSQTLEACSQAKQLEGEGDYRGAHAIMEAAGRYLDRLTEHTRACVLLLIGTLTCRLSSSGQIVNAIEQAKDCLTQSLDLFERTNDRSGAAEACYGLGLCLRYEGAFDDARVWLNSALDRTSNNDRELLCRILLLSAIVEEDAGQLHEALWLLEQVATICDSIENHNLLGTYHNEFALILKKLARVERKHEYEQRALIEYEGACYHYECAGNERFKASSVNNIGVLLNQIGRPADALEKINEAISIAEQVNDKTRQAEFLESKALVLVALNRMLEAEKAARLSVELLRFSGQHSLLAESLVSHGLTLSKINRANESERALRNAEEVAAHVGDFETAGRALVTLLECCTLDFASRGDLHSRVADYLQDSQDHELRTRHLACVKVTFMSAKGGGDGQGIFGQEFSLPTYLNLLELELIKRAFSESDGTLSGAAKLLGITVSCLNEKKKKFPTIHGLQKNVKRRSIIKKKPLLPNLGCVNLAEDDESMSGLGINGGDSVIYRKGVDVREGEPVVLVSREVDFVGIYRQTAAGVELLPAVEGYDIWLFQPNTFEVGGRIIAYVKAADRGKSDAQVHMLGG